MQGGGPPIPSRSSMGEHDDEGIHARKPEQIDDEIDFTPMVDIVFLLLIFFIMTTNISSAKKVALPKAFHGDNVVEKDCVVLIVEKGSGDNAQVSKADGVPLSNDVDQQESEIAEYVEAGLGGGKTQVMIKAEGDVRYGEVERIRRAISTAVEEGQLIQIGVHQ
jgi:biopolymer transport protein ExbD